MFEYLKPFDKVVVIGPSRSGTRIATKIIAYETGKLYVDEGWFGSSDETKFYQFLTMPEEMVIQAPNMSPIVHVLREKETLAIVLIRRRIKDILESQENLNRFDVNAKGNFITYNRDMLYRYGKTEGITCEVVYAAWDEYQKKQIKNWFEIEYDYLKHHLMFIKKEDRRKHFKSAMQTSLNSEKDKYYIENTNKVCYRWTPSYIGEKVAI